MLDKGVATHGLRYNSPGLQTLRQCIGVKQHGGTSQTVKLYLDHDDLGEILVYDHFSKEFIVAEALDAAYARGMSLHAHRLARQQLEIYRRGSESSDIIARAKRRMQEEVQALTTSASLRNRKKAAKITRQRLNTTGMPNKAGILASPQALPADPVEGIQAYETLTIKKVRHGE